MSAKFMSNEEFREYLNDFSPTTRRFAEEALESGICKFMRGCSTVIIVQKPELQELNKDVVGLYLSINRDEIWAYVAVDRDSYGIRDWLNLGTYYTNDSFNNVVSKACKAAGTCNYCHAFVGYNDIHQVSFAGKSCTKCLPAARAKDEPPGWYN